VPVPINATLMRRDVWDAGERDLPLPDDAAPDTFIFVRAALAGWPFFAIEEPLMAYRLHQDQTSRDERYIERVIRTWERFSFADERCEDMRLRQLAGAHIVRATSLLYAGHGAAAQADLRRAAAWHAREQRGRRLGLAAVTRVPRLLPAARRVWRALRGRPR
jgi:hypothetical protein